MTGDHIVDSSAASATESVGFSLSLKGEKKGRKRKVKDSDSLASTDGRSAAPKPKKRLSDLTDHFPTVELPSNRRLSRSLTRSEN